MSRLVQNGPNGYPALICEEPDCEPAWIWSLDRYNQPLISAIQAEREHYREAHPDRMSSAAQVVAAAKEEWDRHREETLRSVRPFFEPTHRPGPSLFHIPGYAASQDLRVTEGYPGDGEAPDKEI